MGNHVIRDRIWVSQKLAKCSLRAALAYPWIFLVADDHGRFEYRPRVIWGQVFSAREDVSPQDVKEWLVEYELLGLLKRYHLEGDLAYWTGFEGRPPSKRRPSLYPDPQGTDGVPDGYPKGTDGVPVPFREQTGRVLPAERSGAEQSVAETETEHVTSAVSKSPSSSGNGHGVPEEQRQAYADEVWTEFLRVSGQRATRVMGPGEFSTLKGWMDSGVPLRIVLRGLEDTKGKGGTLSYYGPSVAAAIDYWRRGTQL